MKFLYTTIINALLFYFFLNVFNGINIAGANKNLVINVIAGLLFGVLIAAIPSILKFLKLPANNGATFIMALVVIFVFLFLLQQRVGGLGNISQSVINLGSFGGKVKLGAIQTMVSATVVIALGVVGLKALGSGGGAKKAS